jgi:hypothetical protein
MCALLDVITLILKDDVLFFYPSKLTCKLIVSMACYITTTVNQYFHSIKKRNKCNM